ncbi:MAG: CRISPR-associated endonuclease Cas2 [Chloroflexota bacterium]|nr:CRISPR-associated endonuclease Cas2 [Chloroflexota bacterium]
MSDHRSRHVIVYDIPKDGRRNKVAAILEGYGDRVQYSVFECLLTKEQFEALWQELGEVVEASEDSVRAYRLCAACVAWTKTLGEAKEVVVPDVYVA